MPMLPSGRHVAIRLAPLGELISDAASPFNVHKVLSIREKADLHPFTEVLWLLPEGRSWPPEIDVIPVTFSITSQRGWIPSTMRRYSLKSPALGSPSPR